MENATDMQLDGPGLSWVQSRSYNSGLAGSGVVGNRWMGNSTEMFLVTTDTGVDVLETANAKFPFTYDSGSGTYTAPQGVRMTLEHNSSEFWLTNIDTQQIWVFNDFTVSPAEDQGRLKETTNVAWNGAGHTGITYDYTWSSGAMSTVTATTSGAQADSVTSTFSNGRLATLTLSEGSTVIKKVEYFYWDDITSAHADAGTAGDLVYVKTSSRAAGDTGSTLSIVRYMLYRYASDSKLKGVYDHAAVMRALAHFSQTDPTWLITKADSYTTGSGSKVQDYASRWFTFYASDLNTASNITTSWATENLQTKYGGANRDETGFVASERVGAACASCGGGGSGLTYEYYYLQFDQGSVNDDNEVKYLIIEDAKDTTGNQHRKIYGLNAEGRQLRDVFTDDPTAGTPKYWCQSWILNVTSDWNGATPHPEKRYTTSEYRAVSAHNVTSSNIAQFLDPYDDTGAGSWTNDTNTLRAASDSAAGPTNVYTYDSHGRLTDVRIKRGYDSTSLYYLGATDYGNGSTVPLNFPVKYYEYPTKTTSRNTADQTSLSYDFWDTTTKLRPKKVTTTFPTISTAQNGSGIAATSEVYYDQAGRERWVKDAEGYVAYYSYHPVTGAPSYTMVDVNDPSSPGSEITGGDNSGAGGADAKWLDWTVDGANSNYPTRGSGLPTGLGLVTKQEYDNQGRSTLLTNPGGDRHATVYKSDRTIQFPYLNSSGYPQAPIVVDVLNSAAQATERYEVKADYSSISITSTVPTGFSTTPSQSDYVSWLRYSYDDETGQLSQKDTYHTIPSSGAGTISTNFNRTVYQYDAQGRGKYAIKQVSGAPGTSGSGVEQVIQLVYDKLGRVTEMKRGVSSASSDIGDDYSNYPTLATVAKTYYDWGDETTALQVGDSYVTRMDRYFGIGTSDYAKVEYYRTWRGHLRSRRPRTSSNGTILNYPTMSLDWMGRPVASAIYTNSSTWLTVLGADDGYGTAVADNSTNRNELTKTYYNSLGKVYRTERFPGTEGTKHFELNNYYDRDGQLVATGEKNAAHTETAYDGDGRQYQQRTVVKLENDDATYGKFTSSGAFNYVEPAPHPSLASMDTTGDDGVIELAHTVYDSAGNATEQHTFEVNSSDTNGIDIDATTSYVRRSVFSYYDGADRLTTVADYGSGDGTSSPATWSYTTRPSRPSEPGWTTSTVYNGYVLLSKYGYDASAGRMTTVTTGVSQNGSDTNKVTTKTFYDALGRRTAVAENWVNATADGTNAGGGTNNVEDRVTKFTYNGLGQQTKITAVNVTSSSTVNEETKYYYEDAYNAFLLTHTVSPDSASTPSSGTDLVKVEYNLDGTPNKKTDQRGVEITYAYDDARRLKAEEVTSFGSSGAVDDAVQSITRKYDDLGRLTKVTSHGNATDDPDNTTSIENQIVYTYDSTHGRLTTTEQSHDGAVSSSPSVQYAYDDTVTSNVYTNSLRQKKVTYPGGRIIHSTYGSSGSMADVLNRLDKYEADSSGSPGSDLVIYSYNGTSRVAKTDYTDNDLDAAVRSEHSWDRFGRTVTQRWYRYHSGSGVRDQVDYTYDYAGDRLTRNVRVGLVNGTYSDTRDQKYTYDGLQRLNDYDQGTWSGSAITSSNLQRSWKLDQLGNWAQTFSDLSQSTSEQTRTHNAANELTEIDSVSTYVAEDAAGNMTKIPKPTSWSAAFDLKYDAWNRLVEVKDNGTTVQTNEYDGLGRRIQRVAGSDTYDYYYNEEWQLLEERKNSDTDPLNQYLWHPYYIDALAIRWYDADTNPGTGVADYYYLQDANYNVTAVTDHSGDIVERYAYSPYGTVTVLDANFGADADGVSDLGNTHFYTGRELDAETGLQLNRNRYYSAWMGRWINRDPEELIDGLNLYQYVKSAPLASVDPFGLMTRAECFEACLKAYLLCLVVATLGCGELCAYYIVKCAVAPYPINGYYCIAAAKCMWDCMRPAAFACTLLKAACDAKCLTLPKCPPPVDPEPPKPPVA